jgi:hypothetical protein
MRNILRQLFASVLILIFLSSACRALTGVAPTPKGASPTGQTPLPATTATSAGLASVPLIPITGNNVVFMQCQFCVGDETHAVLIFPESAYFDVDQSFSATCLTADVRNGKRIVICRGPQETSFNISICSDPSNCLRFPVALQPCALLQSSITTFPPVILTPINKRTSGEENVPAPPPANTATPLPSTNPPASSQPPEPTLGPKATNQPGPTNEPRPTHQPQPTHEPKPTHDPKPTHQPMPTKKPKPQ